MDHYTISWRMIMRSIWPFDRLTPWPSPRHCKSDLSKIIEEIRTWMTLVSLPQTQWQQNRVYLNWITATVVYVCHPIHCYWWQKNQAIIICKKHRGGGGVNQAYSRLSTIHAHITDCKLDSVMYAGVCVWVNVDLSCLDRTIYARQFLGAKPPIQFRHRGAEVNQSDHLYWLRAAQSVA